MGLARSRRLALLGGRQTARRGARYLYLRAIRPTCFDGPFILGYFPVFPPICVSREGPPDK